MRNTSDLMISASKCLRDFIMHELVTVFVLSIYTYISANAYTTTNINFDMLNKIDMIGPLPESHKTSFQYIS